MNVYETDFWLNEETKRPGGLELTEKLTRKIEFGSSILDVGCGDGATVAFLLSKGFEAWGTDISEVMIERAENRVPKASFIVSDSLNLPFKNNSFDGVICECTMSVIEEPLMVLNEINRILKEGGCFLLSDLYLKKESSQDGRLWDVATWVEVLIKEGFRIESVADRKKELDAFYMKALWDGTKEHLKSCIPEGYCAKDIGYFSLIGRKGVEENG